MTTVADKNEPLKLHATAVAISGAGVMMTGESGSGKSDLALRLIDRGATLIADDYVIVERNGGDLLLRPPARLAGKLEVRSLGILECEYLSEIALKLVINLKDDPDRYPIDTQSTIVLGITVPICTLDAMEQSATIKAELALKQILRDGADR